MTEVIPTLIDKQDGFEVIRDQIAVILATESANQQVLALAALEDPELWRLRIFTERSNPWEEWLNSQADRAPIVNVWYDSGTFPEGRGDVVERQIHAGVFRVDCYGLGISAVDGAGHIVGDQEAAFVAQRAVRLVRNILMAGLNAYLQLRGTVAIRWPASITMMQPAMEAPAAQKIVGARFELRVEFNEFSPQVAGDTLEWVFVDVKRTETGEIVLQAEYDVS